MLGGLFTVHRGVLCLAVAALMPVPSALAGQPLPGVSAPSSSWVSTAHAQTVPLVPVSVPRPPSVSKAGQARNHDNHADRSRHRKDGRDKKRAVIRTTDRERILDISANTSYDVPLAALNAYRNAATRVASSYPSCHLSWGVIAAIGQVESDHGRFGGASVLANGVTAPRIVGMQLNGHGVAAIRDTDNGVLDGDKVWDRAVGPMQFIPGTWAGMGVDGDGDGRRNPSDFDDAALATGLYLCGAGGDFTSLAQATANVMRYNHSQEYVDLVLRIANAYDSGVVDVVPNDPPPPPVRPVRHPARHPVHRPAHHPVRHPVHHPVRRPVDHSSPTPHHPGPTKPPPPTPLPPPPPTPDPEPKPVVKTYTGTWTWVSAAAGTVRSTTISLPLPAAVLATLSDDVDGDGNATESTAKEVEGLTGGTVTAVTTDGKVTAFTVNSTPPPPSPTTRAPTSTPATSPPSTESPNTVTVTASASTVAAP